MSSYLQGQSAIQFYSLMQQKDDESIRPLRYRRQAPYVSRTAMMQRVMTPTPRALGRLGYDAAIPRVILPARRQGIRNWKTLIGTTVNSNGNVLASCTVMAWLTAGDVYVGSTTSDSSGVFRLYTPYTGNHYLVAFLVGSPDVAGTTDNTMVPG